MAEKGTLNASKHKEPQSAYLYLGVSYLFAFFTIRKKSEITS